MVEQIAAPDNTEDDTPEVELVPPAYAFVQDDAQRLRCFILEHLGNAEIDGRILIDNMDDVFDWITDRKKPRKSAQGKHLKSVEG